MEDCCARTRIRTEEEKKALKRRIGRIVGQMNGIGRMIDEDRYCADVLIQLSAVDKAVKSLAAVVLEAHLNTCIVENIQKGNIAVVEEVVDLFRRFE